MTSPAKKKAHVISSFTDAGTEESFTAGATPQIEAGAFANYEAAGLVRAASAERAPRKPAKPKATATRMPRTKRGSSGPGITEGGTAGAGGGKPPAPDEIPPQA